MSEVKAIKGSTKFQELFYKTDIDVLLMGGRLSNLRQQWNDTCKAAGLVSIGKDTAAKLLAIVYVLGGEREAFTHNEKLKADIKYIQDVFGFQGGETPNQEVVEPMKSYVNELEANEKEPPQWATKLMQENYGIKL